MIQAILFDLDDTLLGSQMDRFLPGYFDAIGDYCQSFLEKKRFLKELLYTTQAAMAPRDTAVTNETFFWQVFYERTGLSQSDLNPVLERFYLEEFPKLQSTTEKKAFAPELVQACFAQGLKVVIATNPIFPRLAVEARLAWAGVPVNEFAYDLVTTYENMHATKPHEAYYREILAAIGCEPAHVLMVGDQWQNDLVAPLAMGAHGFWICADGETPPAPVAGHGSLTQLYDLVCSDWLKTLS